jgi:hypothetical protein
MSDLTDRLRARADKDAIIAGWNWRGLMDGLALGGYDRWAVEAMVDRAVAAARKGSQGLDLREAADRLDKAEAGLAAWEWSHGVGQSSPPEGVLTVTEGFAGLPEHHQPFAGLPDHHQPKGGMR